MVLELKRKELNSLRVLIGSNKARAGSMLVIIEEGVGARCCDVHHIMDCKRLMGGKGEML